MPEKIVTTDSSAQTAALFGAGDSHIRHLESRFAITIHNVRSSAGEEGDALVLSGEEPGLSQAASALEYL